MESENGHLLVVDPNEINRDRLYSILEQLGYKVSVAADGHQALGAIAQHRVDLVLLDVTQQLGLEVLQQLKAEDTLHRRPVIVLAGEDSLESVEKALQKGADDYLLVPFSPVLLKARIDACLEKESLRDEARSQLVKLAAKEKLADDFTNIILPLGIALSAEKEFDPLLERIVIEAKSICNADVGLFYLRTEDNQLKFVIYRNDSLNVAWGGTTGHEITLPPVPLYDATGQPNVRDVAAHVAITRKSINIPDIERAQGFNFSDEAYDKEGVYRSVSCLTIPLKNNDNEILGVVQLVNAQNPNTGEVIPFNAYLQQVVESLASQASISLNNQLLLQREKKFLKGDRDLEIGRMIQADFLPETLPQASGWEIAARFSPARQVAGDFYDAFYMTHGRIGLVIADVCDKGVGPAMFMALCRSLIRVLAQQNYTLSLLDVLSDDAPKGGGRGSQTQQQRLPNIGSQALKNAMKLTNDYIGNNHSRTNMFATMFFGVLDTASGKLIYINAGHELPLICGPNGIKERLKTTGPAVGMMPNIDFKIQQTKLEQGDILFTYTDGVPEAHNPQGQLFTDEKLFALLQQPAHSAEALLIDVETKVRAHTAGADQFDDITMLAVRWIPVAKV